MINLNKKGQVKNLETIAVLVIFFFLIMVGFVVYFKFFKTSTEAEIQRYNELDAVKTAQLVSYLPELYCSENNVIVPGCFDEVKIRYLNSSKILILKKDYYYNTLGYSYIKFNYIYPIKQTLTIYNYSHGEDIVSLFNIPISICNYNSIQKECSFAIMEVGVYQ